MAIFMDPRAQCSEFKLGFIFISVAVVFWGILPIALKLSGQFIDAVTLTWFRFLVALVVGFAIQYLSGSIKQFRGLDKVSWLKITLAGVFLIFNYVSFVYSLKYLAPGSAQLNFQTAPFFLAFGGMLFFKERLNAIQLSCFATLGLGMLMFFHPYLDFTSGPSDVWKGVMIVQFSVLSWASYALIQKSMIKRLSPNNILLFIYLFGILAMAPFSDFSQFTVMDSSQWAIAIFCAINTVIAYGCFGQSMKYWPTGQVSAMLALTPVLSFSLTAIVVGLGWWSDIIKGAVIDELSFTGIVMIVVSVILVQLSPMWQKRRAQREIKAAV
ncbi:DMT family transporter [Shewanella schlegeliana]|uniref:DMT family transporter n=1 Tax=Shewanella schlegeliana TaxID=190308 RepID=A0ABS1T7X8_9GAMM|nr:DMT family transporter [Shewanella schlegeliana]MBL4915576.1 DMT family transporter [Shewanella schlegeliana]MCL1111857.1 DMT family transporter [Shewanella schlegeliana]